MNKHISIIDHVGNKAGMDYYSSSLAKGFLQSTSKCTVYSNFIGISPDKIQYKVYFEGHTKSSALKKLYRLIKATVKSSYDARKKKSDLIILHLFSANLITLLLVLIPKLFGLKTAVISHDVSSFSNNDNAFFQKLIYNTFADYIIVHNQFSYETLLKNVNIINPSKVKIIKQGGYVDLIKSVKSKDYLREELGLSKNGKYILFFGQIKEVKGLDILLEAMHKMPDDIKLIIAGKPWKNDFSKYDNIIEKYNFQNRVVKIIRFIEDDEREKLFLVADVNVLPYRIIYQSAVLLMAMSYSLPVIASDLPANKEIIEDGKNGMLFKSEDVNDLNNQINAFFDNQQVLHDMAKQALETIQHEYSWDKIANNYIQMLRGQH